MADLLGVVLGTGILWGLKIFGTYPLAKRMVGKNIQPATTGVDKNIPKETPVDPDAKYCSECGTALDAEAGFCINCGYDLKKSLPVTASDPKGQGAPAQHVDEVDAIPLGTYVLADSVVLGIGGLIISLVTGWFFVGFSLKPRDWPGMIVFVLSTLIGSGMISV